MKILNICISAFFMVSVSAEAASAQESGSSREYHPFLSDNFNIGLGVYRPSQKRRLGAAQVKALTHLTLRQPVC